MEIKLGISPALVVLAIVSQTHAASPAFQSAVQTGNPLLYYKLNELPGATVALNSGSLGATYNADYKGAPTLGVATQLGDTAVSFNGVNDWLESDGAAPAGLTGNPTFSIETIALMPDDTTSVGYPPFLYWGDNGTGNSVYFSMHSNDNDRVYAGFYNAGLSMTGTITQGTWHHMVMVRVGGGNSLTGTTLYVDGQSVPLATDTVLCCNTAVPTVTSTKFRINRTFDLTRYFVGSMDEVALYDRALTESEVQQHFAAFLPGHISLKIAGSRRTHGAAGFFDFAIPLAGPPLRDPRQSGANPQVFLGFDESFEAVDGAIDCGSEVVVVNGNCLGIQSAQSTSLVVNMTYNKNACVKVFVSGLRGAGGGPPLMGDFGVRVLTQEGNVTGDSVINLLDLQAIKSNLLKPVTVDTFKYDINVNGSINLLDLQAVKSNLLQTPSCP